MGATKVGDRLGVTLGLARDQVCRGDTEGIGKLDEKVELYRLPPGFYVRNG